MKWKKKRNYRTYNKYFRLHSPHKVKKWIKLNFHIQREINRLYKLRNQERKEIKKLYSKIIIQIKDIIREKIQIKDIIREKKPFWQRN